MQRYQLENPARLTTAAAALAATLVTAAFVDALFGPGPTAIGAQAAAAARRNSPVQVAIVPSRIEVVASRASDVAEAAAALRVMLPGS